MLPGLLQAQLMNKLQRSAVLPSSLAKGQGIIIDNKAGPRGWQGLRVAIFDKVAVVKKEENWWELQALRDVSLCWEGVGVVAWQAQIHTSVADEATYSFHSRL